MQTEPTNKDGITWPKASQPAHTPNIAAYLANAIKSIRGKLPIVSIDDDAEVITRVKHTMAEGESLGAWYSRTGLGRSQILVMTPEQITRFCEQADRRNAIDPNAPGNPIFERIEMPRHFTLE